MKLWSVSRSSEVLKMCAIIENPEISSAPGIDTNLGDACVLQLVPEITIVPSGIRALDQDATKQVIERLMGAEDECVDWLITIACLELTVSWISLTQRFTTSGTLL
mmetsp:Transcript_96055/g.173305  ORF Transcript_96055/g.173305 Transcript_96055/m.173305 type:complete len:106 (-) Transcript_96055:118-435(-)